MTKRKGQDSLFVVGERKRTRHEWGRWLPVPSAGLCPREFCRQPLIEALSAIQPALFIHGGYGAADRTTFEFCGNCGWARVVATETISPLDLRAG